MSRPLRIAAVGIHAILTVATATGAAVAFLVSLAMFLPQSLLLSIGLPLGFVGSVGAAAAALKGRNLLARVLARLSPIRSYRRREFLRARAPKQLDKGT
jgi:hypothetical protein